ncbi:hypothetical protein [Maribacter sp. 2307ULW6-5]|uniref:hypothetical protein n=1 Tax=Maribacter sp. 2307ULW6-5 TaxID=3386275 RepID=UPI0039BD877B
MYSEKTDKELLEIMGHYHTLTFEAMTRLHGEMEQRKMVVDKTPLTAAITERKQRIENLELLPAMGFFATEDAAGALVVKRTLKAQVWDVLAVLVGLVVFLAGVYGCASLFSMFANGDEVNVFSLAVNLGMASLVYLGFTMLQGLKRLVDFMGFKMVAQAGTVSLSKRFDMKLENVAKPSEAVGLEYQEETVALYLGDLPVFSANAGNTLQKLTMEALAARLHKS